MSRNRYHTVSPASIGRSADRRMAAHVVSFQRTSAIRFQEASHAAFGDTLDTDNNGDMKWSDAMRPKNMP